jgi:2'-5' RNA ligase
VPRLFIAFEVPEEIREAVLREVPRLKRTGAEVRFAAKDHLHVTVRFLGEVPEGSIPEVSAMLGRACEESAPFGVEVRGLGTFGGRAPRVVWAGVAGISEPGARALHRLHRMVDEGARQLGFPSDRDGFSGHLTLGRVKSPKKAPALLEAVRASQDRVFGRFQVGELVLFRSVLGSEGSVYTALLRSALRGGAAGPAGGPGDVPPGS